MASKRKQNKQRKPIRRQTRHFQLRVDHPQDSHVREILDFAKSQRREVTLIRDAIALFWALENGDLEALFEKFPQYRAQFDPWVNSPGDGGRHLSDIKAMLELLTAQQTTQGYTMKSVQLPSVTALPILPKAEVKQSAISVTADEIADNFLSMFT